MFLLWDTSIVWNNYVRSIQNNIPFPQDTHKELNYETKIENGFHENYQNAIINRLEKQGLKLTDKLKFLLSTWKM